MRFRNDTGSVLTVSDLGVKLGPDEVLDWPGWSRQVHGVIPGCSLLDEDPDAPDESGAGDEGASGGQKDDDPPPGTGTPSETGASDEEPQA